MVLLSPEGSIGSVSNRIKEFEANSSPEKKAQTSTSQRPSPGMSTGQPRQRRAPSPGGGGRKMQQQQQMVPSSSSSSSSQRQPSPQRQRQPSPGGGAGGAGRRVNSSPFPVNHSPTRPSPGGGGSINGNSVFTPTKPNSSTKQRPLPGSNSNASPSVSPNTSSSRNASPRRSRPPSPGFAPSPDGVASSNSSPLVKPMTMTPQSRPIPGMNTSTSSSMLTPNTPRGTHKTPDSPMRSFKRSPSPGRGRVTPEKGATVNANNASTPSFRRRPTPGAVLEAEKKSPTPKNSSTSTGTGSGIGTTGGGVQRFRFSKSPSGTVPSRLNISSEPKKDTDTDTGAEPSNEDEGKDKVKVKDNALTVGNLDRTKTAGTDTDITPSTIKRQLSSGSQTLGARRNFLAKKSSNPLRNNPLFLKRMAEAAEESDSDDDGDGGFGGGGSVSRGDTQSETQTLNKLKQMAKVAEDQGWKKSDEEEEHSDTVEDSQKKTSVVNVNGASSQAQILYSDKIVQTFASNPVEEVPESEDEACSQDNSEDTSVDKFEFSEEGVDVDSRDQFSNVKVSNTESTDLIHNFGQGDMFIEEDEDYSDESTSLGREVISNEASPVNGKDQDVSKNLDKSTDDDSTNDEEGQDSDKTDDDDSIGSQQHESLNGESLKSHSVNSHSTSSITNGSTTSSRRAALEKMRSSYFSKSESKKKNSDSLRAQLNVLSPSRKAMIEKLKERREKNSQSPQHSRLSIHTFKESGNPLSFFSSKKTAHPVVLSIPTDENSLSSQSQSISSQSAGSVDGLERKRALVSKRANLIKTLAKSRSAKSPRSERQSSSIKLNKSGSSEHMSVRKGLDLIKFQTAETEKRQIWNAKETPKGTQQSRLTSNLARLKGLKEQQRKTGQLKGNQKKFKNIPTLEVKTDIVQHKSDDDMSGNDDGSFSIDMMSPPSTSKMKQHSPWAKIMQKRLSCQSDKNSASEEDFTIEDNYNQETWEENWDNEESWEESSTEGSPRQNLKKSSDIQIPKNPRTKVASVSPTSRLKQVDADHSVTDQSEISKTMSETFASSVKDLHLGSMNVTGPYAHLLLRSTTTSLVRLSGPTKSSSLTEPFEETKPFKPFSKIDDAVVKNAVSNTRHPRSSQTSINYDDEAEDIITPLQSVKIDDYGANNGNSQDSSTLLGQDHVPSFESDQMDQSDMSESLARWWKDTYASTQNQDVNSVVEHALSLTSPEPKKLISVDNNMHLGSPGSDTDDDIFFGLDDDDSPRNDYSLAISHPNARDHRSSQHVSAPETNLKRPHSKDNFKEQKIRVHTNNHHHSPSSRQNEKVKSPGGHKRFQSPSPEAKSKESNHGVDTSAPKFGSSLICAPMGKKVPSEGINNAADVFEGVTTEYDVSVQSSDSSPDETDNKFSQAVAGGKVSKIKGQKNSKEVTKMKSAAKIRENVVQKKGRIFLDKFACGVLEPMRNGRNVNSGLGDEGTIDLSVLDESDDDSDGESASTDTGSTHSDASETMTSRMSSNVSLSARERRRWDEWDKKDNETNFTGDSMSDTEDDTTIEGLRRKALHLEHRARAHEKLLMHAYAALSAPAQTKMIEKMETDSQIQNYNSMNKQLSGIYSNTENIAPSLSPSVDFSRYAMKNTLMSMTDTYVQQPSSNPSVKTLKSLTNQRKTLEKFCSRIKNEGIEVLKLNRENKWQTRYLTVSSEGTWLKKDNDLGNGDSCFCPLGILWLKKLNKNKEHSISNIDKQGRGGMLLANLTRANEVHDYTSKYPMSRKQLDQFKGSAVIRLYSDESGPMKFITLRCTKPDAVGIILGCNAIIDVLRGSNILFQKKSQTNLQTMQDRPIPNIANKGSGSQRYPDPIPNIVNQGSSSQRYIDSQSSQQLSQQASVVSRSISGAPHLWEA